MALTLRNTKGSKLTFNEMDGNFTYLEDLSNANLTTSAFNAFTGSASMTGSFTGSFVGDGSGLTGISGGSIETGSFATTGSNDFDGNQTINGSLSFSGSYAQATEYRLGVVGSTFYLNRSGSLGGGQNTYQTEIHHNGSKTQFKSDGSVRMELNGNVFQVQGDIDVTIGNQVTNAISASYFSGSFFGDGSQLTGISGGESNWYDGTTYLSSSVDVLVEGGISGSNISASGEIYAVNDVKVGSFVNTYDNSTTVGDGFLSFMRNSGDPFITLTRNAAQPNSEMSNITFKGYLNSNYYNKAKISVINGDATDSVNSTLAFSTKATGGLGTFQSSDIDLEIVSGSAVNIYRDTTLNGSLTVSGSEVLTLTPTHPLPSSPSTGSFAVSGSTPPIPYFYDGSSWNALY